MGRGPVILCDTHAWIWWAGEDRRLSAAARRAIEASSVVGIPMFSCWELAMLVEHGRLELDRDVLQWIRDALALPRVRVIDLEPEILVQAARLDWSHRDPVDRMIVATALHHRLPVITRDRTIRSFAGIETIW